MSCPVLVTLATRVSLDKGTKEESITQIKKEGEKEKGTDFKRNIKSFNMMCNSRNNKINLHYAFNAPHIFAESFKYLRVLSWSSMKEVREKLHLLPVLCLLKLLELLKV